MYLSKRRAGYYYVCWKSKTPDGRWITKAKALKTKNKVVAQRIFNNSYADGADTVKECCLEDWVKLFERSLSQQDLDSKTVSKYVYHARRFIDFFDIRIRKMSDFGHEHMIEFMENIKQLGNSKSTVAGYGRSLRKMFNIALDLEYIRKSPMAKVKVGKIEQRQRYFNQEEIKRILEVARADERSLALVLFFMQLGLRIQEAVDSRWENINHNNRTIKVIGKCKKIRIQKIPQLAYDAIMKFKDKWSTIFGRSQKSLYRELKAILDKAGVEGSPHTFRDTFATYSIRTMPLSTLRERMGHGSLVQTDKYTHALNSEVEEEILNYFNDWQIKT